MLTLSSSRTDLSVFSEDFGMETNPVLRHEELALVQDFFLESTGKA